MPIYYKQNPITLPSGHTMSDFTWEIDNVWIDVRERKGIIIVRCIPQSDPGLPRWCLIRHNNLTNNDTTLPNVILKVKSVITGTVEL